MKDKIESQGVAQEWFKDFIESLKLLSKRVNAKGQFTCNEDYASIGTTVESKQLIQELCDDIDEEYSFRHEVEHESDLDEWLEKKTEETLDELAVAGIIDKPSDKDIEDCHKTVRDSIAASITEEAKQAALELNSDTDALISNENKWFGLNSGE